MSEEAEKDFTDINQYAEFGKAAEKVSALRRARDMSVGELSKLSGLTVSQISMIEKGTRKPNTEHIARIEQAFALPPFSFAKRWIWAPVLYSQPEAWTSTFAKRAVRVSLDKTTSQRPIRQWQPKGFISMWMSKEQPYKQRERIGSITIGKVKT